MTTTTIIIKMITALAIAMPTHMGTGEAIAMGTTTVLCAMTRLLPSASA
jgi:hypothetical protein